MHAERYRVPPDTWAACEAATRVVAVGTTTVRALESAFGRAATAETVHLTAERLGLFDPVPVQYWHWLKGIFLGLLLAYVVLAIDDVIASIRFEVG